MAKRHDGEVKQLTKLKKHVCAFRKKDETSGMAQLCRLSSWRRNGSVHCGRPRRRSKINTGEFWLTVLKMRLPQALRLFRIWCSRYRSGSFSRPSSHYVPDATTAPQAQAEGIEESSARINAHFDSKIAQEVTTLGTRQVAIVYICM